MMVLGLKLKGKEYKSRNLYSYISFLMELSNFKAFFFFSPLGTTTYIVLIVKNLQLCDLFSQKIKNKNYVIKFN